MDRVKIKRIKRNKEKATLGEKIVAGLSVGSALFGAGGGALAGKINPMAIVRIKTAKAEGVDAEQEVEQAEQENTNANSVSFSQTQDETGPGLVADADLENLEVSDTGGEVESEDVKVQALQSNAVSSQTKVKAKAAKNIKAAVSRARTPDLSISASGKLYQVKKGDTFWELAQKHYGDGRKWYKIMEANPASVSRPNNPRTLQIGAVLNIPPLD